VQEVLVLASFDNLKSRHMRLVQEAAGLGSVHVLLLSDLAVQARSGEPPKFPQAERQYFVEAIRYVDRVSLVAAPVEVDALPAEYVTPGVSWAVEPGDDNPAKRSFCQHHDLRYVAFTDDTLSGFPAAEVDERPSEPGTKKVLVTGCFDWFHSGHVRFFEEVAQMGDLYVVLGHDANIELLKGEGHPMYSEHERRYMASSIRFVKQALISSGNGWLDAEPEIERLQPDIYAVNEDGDRAEKREYCAFHGIEYRVLKRLPKEGLPKRQSTDFRGF
jgi:cytidyltransferase-like protein